jgi:type IV secretory pathway VirB10-like protein
MNHPTSNTQKNGKAAIITFSVHALLLLIFFLLSFKTPPAPPPVIEEGIEVNLGNSDIGFGDIQPLQPGEPAPAEEAAISTPPPPQPAEEVEETEKEISEKDDADAPEIKKTTKKTEAKKTPVNENKTIVTNKKSTTTETPPSPKPVTPKPKAVFSGGNGTGGNGADDFNNSRNQGIAGGNGDQGKPGGNPNSDSYTGNGGNGSGGPKVVSGNRKIVKAYSFTGDLDKATIYAIIKVSPDGKGTFIDFAKNSTSRNTAYKNAIINYLPRIQFNNTAEESRVTVRFEFNVD